ncbi:MAG: lipocalin family protein [Cryobacterium sp.]|nr:lipocalin family protein [Oligoflexia bacterium]
MTTNTPFKKTAPNVDLSRYLKKWFVITGRTTFLEKDAYASTETYRWNEAEKRIDVDFKCRRGSFTGKIRSIPQKAWVSETSNAQWKIQFIWPFKADYLILAHDPDYHWTAVGVPSQRYLWIMSDQPQLSPDTLTKIISDLDRIDYSTRDLKPVPQNIQNHPNSI